MEGKDLSNDTLIRVIGPMQPEICTSENLGAKFPVTTRGYSIVKIVRLDDAFSELFQLEACPVEGEPLLPGKRKEKKSGKRKSE